MTLRAGTIGAAWRLSLVVLLLGCWQVPTLSKQGGYVLTYRLAAGESADPDQMTRAIQNRLDQARYKGAIVRAVAGGQFEIELPGADANAVSQVKELLRSTGSLEFRILAHRQLHAEEIARALDSPGGKPAGPGSFWRKYDPKDFEPDDLTVTRVTENQQHEVLVMDDEQDLNANHLKSLTPGFDSNAKPCLYGHLKEEGALFMAQLTKAHPGISNVHLAIIYDDLVVAAPTIRQRITDRFQFTGNFTQEEIERMAAVLKSGSLPARLDPTPVSERRIEPE